MLVWKNVRCLRSFSPMCYLYVWVMWPGLMERPNFFSWCLSWLHDSKPEEFILPFFWILELWTPSVLRPHFSKALGRIAHKADSSPVTWVVLRGRGDQKAKLVSRIEGGEEVGDETGCWDLGQKDKHKKFGGLLYWRWHCSITIE